MKTVFNCTEKDHVLFVGEGNFSFSSNLVKNEIANNLSGTQFVSTCFQSEEGDEKLSQPNEKSNEIKTKNIAFLRKSSCEVLFEVDAVKLDSDDRFKDKKFTKIIFMFPHVGGKMKIHLNRELVKNFLASCDKMLAHDGSVIVTLCRGQGGTPAEEVQKKVAADTWKVVEGGAEGGFVLNGVEKFPVDQFPQYSQVGYRGMENKGFHVEGSIVHIFKYSPLPCLVPLEMLPCKRQKMSEPAEDFDFASVFSNFNSTPKIGPPSSLYPPSYTHHISFWESSPVSDNDIADVVVASVGGFVVDWTWLDKYEKDGRTSRTAKVKYFSKHEALGPKAAFNLHINVLGKSLENILDVELR